MTELDPMAITSTVPPVAERECAALAMGSRPTLRRAEEVPPVAH